MSTSPTYHGATRIRAPYDEECFQKPSSVRGDSRQVRDWELTDASNHDAFASGTVMLTTGDVKRALHDRGEDRRVSGPSAGRWMRESASKGLPWTKSKSAQGGASKVSPLTAYNRDGIAVPQRGVGLSGVHSVVERDDEGNVSPTVRDELRESRRAMSSRAGQERDDLDMIAMPLRDYGPTIGTGVGRGTGARIDRNGNITPVEQWLKDDVAASKSVSSIPRGDEAPSNDSTRFMGRRTDSAAEASAADADATPSHHTTSSDRSGRVEDVKQGSALATATSSDSDRDRSPRSGRPSLLGRIRNVLKADGPDTKDEKTAGYTKLVKRRTPMGMSMIGGGDVASGESRSTFASALPLVEEGRSIHRHTGGKNGRHCGAATIGSLDTLTAEGRSAVSSAMPLTDPHVVRVPASPSTPSKALSPPRPSASEVFTPMNAPVTNIDVGGASIVAGAELGDTRLESVRGGSKEDRVFSPMGSYAA